MKEKSLSRVLLFTTPWTAAHQAPPSMRFSRQEYWSGVPLPSPNFLANKIKSLNDLQNSPYLPCPQLPSDLAYYRPPLRFSHGLPHAALPTCQGHFHIRSCCLLYPNIFFQIVPWLNPLLSEKGFSKSLFSPNYLKYYSILLLFNPLNLILFCFKTCEFPDVCVCDQGCTHE